MPRALFNCLVPETTPSQKIRQKIHCFMPKTKPIDVKVLSNTYHQLSVIPFWNSKQKMSKKSQKYYPSQLLQWRCCHSLLFNLRASYAEFILLPVEQSFMGAAQ